MRHQPCWKGLIVTAIVAAGGVAQAQTGGARYDAEAAAGASDRIDPGSRWGRGLELSEGGRAHSNTPTRGENFVVIRDPRGSPVPGASVDHRMTLGFRGIWPTGSISSNRPTARPLLDWRHDGSGLATSGPGLSSSEEDDEKIIYYTLRYDGIQLGLSYVSGLERGSDRSADSAAATNHDGIAVGANFDRRFDDFGVGVSAGYVSADAFDDLEMPDMDALTVGARFDVGGLRVSGGFQMANEPREDAKQLAASGWDETWNLGARYRWGRNDVSLAYAYGENRADLKAPGDDKFDAATLSYIRKLDRGVKWSVNLLWAAHSGQATGGAADIDGTALSTAVRLSF